MFNKKRKATNNDLQFQRNDYTSDEQIPILHKKTIKELIAPSGIDASNIDHLEIISNVKDMLEASSFLHYQECVHFQNYLEICICLET